MEKIPGTAASFSQVLSQVVLSTCLCFPLAQRDHSIPSSLWAELHGSSCRARGMETPQGVPNVLPPPWGAAQPRQPLGICSLRQRGNEGMQTVLEELSWLCPCPAWHWVPSPATSTGTALPHTALGAPSSPSSCQLLLQPRIQCPPRNQSQFRHLIPRCLRVNWFGINRVQQGSENPRKVLGWKGLQPWGWEDNAYFTL